MGRIDTLMTQDELREIIDYNPETGVAVWINPLSKRVKKGDEIGSIRIDNSGAKYRQVTINRKWYAYHRLVWFYMFGEWPEQIDHINRDTLDNRILNLRAADNAVNSRNRGISKRNKSGVVGVSACGSRWRAQVSVNGRPVCLGVFDTIDEAAKARKDGEKKYGYTQ